MCARGGTFKYYFPRERVADVWSLLASTYGPVRRNEMMKTMEIEGERLIFRATLLATPITVIRKRRCVASDVDAFHALVSFETPSEESDSHGRDS